MENRVKEILNQLDSGEINYKEAINSIKNTNYKTDKFIKKSSGVKISVVNDEQSIKLPKIPFGLLSFLIDIGFGLSSIAIRLMDDIDEDAKKVLDSIDKRDIKQIFKELKKCGPFQLIDIEEGDSTKVKISIL